VVAIVKGEVIGDVDDWDQETHTSDLQAAMGRTCNRLQDLVSAINNWRLWALCDRPPMVSAGEQAKGRVALLGDAAHPMRPYMAQGAGMAIEDATCLQAVLSGPERPMAERLQAYANQRWRRNARVQARSIRNGQISAKAAARGRYPTAGRAVVATGVEPLRWPGSGRLLQIRFHDFLVFTGRFELAQGGVKFVDKDRIFRRFCEACIHPDR
jgi:2-polyprenyl-6-methoxyphenol hydroxylase-like FAD-dependent oxidoreductase